MKKILLSVIAAFIMLSFPQLSVSEIKEGSIEVSPFAGYYFLHERVDRLGFGARVGYNFTKNLGIEGAYDYAGGRADFVHADLLYHLIPENAINPFIFAGVGNAHMKTHNGSYNHLLGEIGVGVKYFLADNIAIRADVRDIQEKYNHVATTVGLVFAFGGKEKPAPPEKIEAKPEPKPVTKVEEKVIVIALEDVHFDHDKSTLTKEAQEVLKKNIKILKENPDIKIIIQGHTSASGSEEYNHALSHRRVDSVETFLLKEGGIASSRLSKIGYGETMLEMPEPNPKKIESAAAKSNRRVVFEIIVK